MSSAITRIAQANRAKLNQDLLAEYKSALKKLLMRYYENAFLDGTPVPEELVDPLHYFFIKEEKPQKREGRKTRQRVRPGIYMLDQFKSTEPPKPIPVTKKGFSKFLKNQFNITYYNYAAVDQYLDLLEKVLREYRLVEDAEIERETAYTDKSNNVFFETSKKSRLFFRFVENEAVFRIDSNENIVIQTKGLLTADNHGEMADDDIRNYVNFRLIPDYVPFEYYLYEKAVIKNNKLVPIGLQKSYLKLLVDQRLLKLDEYKVPPYTLVYKQSKTYMSVSLDMRTGLLKQPCIVSNLRSEYSLAIPVCNTKWIPYTRQTIPLHSENIAELLRQLCGANRTLLQKFERFFCDVWTSNAPGMTVLYSEKNAELLETIIRQVLDSSLIANQRREKNISLKLQMKSQNIRELYLEQFFGKSAVLVCDRPLDAEYDGRKIRILKSLLNGKTQELSPVHSRLPYPTKFKNHLHFICVTSDSKTAEQMLKVCPTDSGRLINFARSESAGTCRGLENEDDIMWFRSAFALRGLMQRAQRPVEEPQAVPFSAEQGDPKRLLVSDYLKDCCSYSGDKNAYVTTDDVYEHFKKYFSLHSPNTECPWTKITFNKEVRNQLEQADKRIAYKERQWVTVNGKKKQRTIYCGVLLKDLPATPMEPETVSFLPTELVQPDVIERELSEIDLAVKDLRFTSFLKTSVSNFKPASKKLYNV